MTVAYAPPERFDAKPRAMPAGDVFSLGVLTYELATGDVPWMGAGGMSLRMGAAVPELPDDYSNKFKRLVESMMSVDPEQRPESEYLAEVASSYLNEGFWSEKNRMVAEISSQKKRHTEKLQSLINEGADSDDLYINTDPECIINGKVVNNGELNSRNEAEKNQSLRVARTEYIVSDKIYKIMNISVWLIIFITIIILLG